MLPFVPTTLCSKTTFQYLHVSVCLLCNPNFRQEVKRASYLFVAAQISLARWMNIVRSRCMNASRPTSGLPQSELEARSDQMIAFQSVVHAAESICSLFNCQLKRIAILFWSNSNLLRYVIRGANLPVRRRSVSDHSNMCIKKLVLLCLPVGPKADTGTSRT